MKSCVKQRAWNSLLSVLCCLLFAACSQEIMPDDDASLRTSANTGTVYMQDFSPVGNEAVGTVVMLTDKRDSAVYRCIKMADGRWWMGENLRYAIAGSVVYAGDVANLVTYGRLYKWQEALDATPQNWCLPSDDEWKALEMALGMTQADADIATAWRNSGNVGTQLKANGSSGMNLLLGGYQHTNGSCMNQGVYGRYWASTESGATAWDRDVYSNKVGVYRGTFSKAYRFSVRCVLQAKETTQYMQTFVPNPADSVGTEVMLTDRRDGVVYRCIKMADNRWWMGENLRYDIEGSVFYDNDSTNLEIYGRLYDWDSSKDYVPEGWSLPTNAEWTALRDSLGGQLLAGGKMKQTGTLLWKSPNTDATNSSKFNGLPGGCSCRTFGNLLYISKGKYSHWWSAESYNCWHLYNTLANLGGPIKYPNDYTSSVRCILNQ